MPEIENPKTALWALLVGLLLIAMAFTQTFLKRLPLSGATIYLLVGYDFGSGGFQLLLPDPFRHAQALEHLTEIALLVSLFCAGLKLRLSFADARWRLALRLALVSMLVTIGLLAALAALLGLPPAAGILLGAILAPTDPVLASDVQVENADDSDRLRFSLTGESGLNDGIAFPFAVLGLALLQADAAIDLRRWLAFDFFWSIGAGLAIGGICGAAVGHLVLYLRTEQKTAVGLDEFLLLGLIAIACGAALLLQASVFLSVFAAALAMTRAPGLGGVSTALPAYELAKLDELATSPQHAGPLMMRAVLGFNEQLERIAEVAIVILVGALLPFIRFDWILPVIVAALIMVIRPAAVMLGLLGSATAAGQRWLTAWFGIRGIGSVYYLFYAVNHGLPRDLAGQLLSIALAVVATSIVVHGISVTPLMNWYKKRRNRLPSR